MEEQILKEILMKHKMWLYNKCEGVKADLRGADLSDADLRCSDLSNADLSDAKIIWPLVCPEEGSFIGFKKSKEGYIIKLMITENAERTSATTRKCRCSEAKVIEITTVEGEKKEYATSIYDKNFIYKIGEFVKVENFDNNRWNECSTGIHFFITRQESIDYL